MILKRTDPDLRALDTLLTREAALLDQGDTRALSALIPEKEALLDRLADRSEDLRDLASGDVALREKLGDLRRRLDRNAARLDTVRHTLRDMATALERIRDRHGLGGLYGAAGTARAGDPARATTLLDREV